MSFATFQKAVVKNLPTILAVAGSIGAVATAACARKDTIRAEQKMEELRRDLKGIDYDNFIKAVRLRKRNRKISNEEIAKAIGCDQTYLEDILEEDVSTKEKAKVYLKSYVPTFLMGAATIACILGGNHIAGKRLAALAGAYMISEGKLKEYKEKMKEVIGEKKADEVESAIIADHLEKNNQQLDEITQSDGLGMNNIPNLSLWYDIFSDRYFYSSSDRIRMAEIEGQSMLNENGFVDLNAIYSMLGLNEIPLGEYLGWDVEQNATVSLNMHHDLKDGRPVGTINVDVRPTSSWFVDV